MELKFRAFGDEVMTYMNNFVYEDSPTENEKIGQFLNWNHSCKIMQYTGLKDKNCVDIYEGDILQGDNVEAIEIEFHNGSFGAYGDYSFIPLSDWNLALYSVVGNVYNTKKGK